MLRDLGSGLSHRLRVCLLAQEVGILPLWLVPLFYISVAITTVALSKDMFTWMTLTCLISIQADGLNQRFKELPQLLDLVTLLFWQVRELLFSEERAEKINHSRTYTLLILLLWHGIKDLEELALPLQDSITQQTSSVELKCTYLVVGTVKITSTMFTF